MRYVILWILLAMAYSAAYWLLPFKEALFVCFCIFFTVVVLTLIYQTVKANKEYRKMYEKEDKEGL